MRCALRWFAGTPHPRPLTCIAAELYAARHVLSLHRAVLAMCAPIHRVCRSVLLVYQLDTTRRGHCAAVNVGDGVRQTPHLMAAMTASSFMTARRPGHGRDENTTRGRTLLDRQDPAGQGKGQGQGQDEGRGPGFIVGLP